MPDQMFAGVPPPKPGPTMLLVQLGAGESIDCVILSRSIFGFATHWDDRAGKKGRSEECTMSTEGECTGCDRELPRRWKGFLHVFCFARKADVFLEITPAVAESIQQQAEHGSALHGQRLILRRGDKGPKTRIRVELQGYKGNVHNEVSEKDVRPILKTLWEWRRS